MPGGRVAVEGPGDGVAGCAKLVGGAGELAVVLVPVMDDPGQVGEHERLGAGQRPVTEDEQRRSRSSGTGCSSSWARQTNRGSRPRHRRRWSGAADQMTASLTGAVARDSIKYTHPTQADPVGDGAGRPAASVAAARHRPQPLALLQLT